MTGRRRLSSAGRASFALALWASGFALAEASACRTISFAPERLARYPSAVLVSVEKASRVQREGWNRFAIASRSVQPLIGTKMARRYAFEATLGSASCGTAPLPPQGEKWVIYLSGPEGAGDRIALPLALARQQDPRLVGIP